MANRVVLDAMIRRADFGQRTEPNSIELGEKLMLEQIIGNSPMSRMLRKPDFQRETNQWSPQQVASLIKSFAYGELIPALILWKSDSFVFVIDGAHRLSALKAWVENDYGDGNVSYGFYEKSIPDDQHKKADQVRRIVEREVGRYADLKNISDEELGEDTPRAKIARNLFTRSLHIQWIQGSQEVAETSFFKINSQGTPLDQVEELLLGNRHTSYAIAARSIVRAGTGHKYWSNFDSDIQEEIEKQAKNLNEILFQPDVQEPIKTLDLPLGGTSSPIDALKVLIDIFSIVDGYSEPKNAFRAIGEDKNGQATINILKRAEKLANRISGNDASSLGLHPAVYFFTEQGKHSRFFFLGVVKLLSEKLSNNDKDWFKKFTTNRTAIEKVLISRKSLINQALSNINSRQRIDRVRDLLNFLSTKGPSDTQVDDTEILKVMGLEGNAGNLQIIDAPKGFSTNVKSAAFLKQAIDSSMRCSICNGLLNASKSVSYDHIIPIRDGGIGTLQNSQLTHPYCNTGYKN